ncbi:MAG: gamma-butyrobetaine hydroxylase-like domain-containing protein [Opitutales bacterium]
MIPAPTDLQLVGDFVALRWPDGHEDVLAMETLRAASPSAANKGEPDLFGRIHGADPRTAFPGVRVEGWEWVGGYAVRFLFSDGHQSGLFSFGLLRQLGEAAGEGASN